MCEESEESNYRRTVCDLDKIDELRHVARVDRTQSTGADESYNSEVKRFAQRNGEIAS